MTRVHQSSWNSSEVPPQDESHGSRLCSLSVLFVRRCDTLIHSTERDETFQRAEVRNPRLADQACHRRGAFDEWKSGRYYCVDNEGHFGDLFLYGYTLW